MNNLVTGKVRFSYVNVFEPRTTPNGEEKYSVTLLVPKSDTQTYQSILSEINKVTQEAVQPVFGGIRPTNLKLPLYDGDGLRASGEEFGAECKGNWVLSAKSNTAPEVVDVQVQPIISKNEFYSGCYGRASIRFYAYNQNGNKGIGCGLGNVQKLEDGQPLDGRTTARDDFGTGLTSGVGAGQYTVGAVAQIPSYQPPMQAPTMPTMQPQVQERFQVDPITGQPIMGQTVNNIYGVAQ